MKTKLFPLLTLIMVSLIVPNICLAAANQTSDVEVSTAQKAGQAWLDKIATINPKLPQWKGALVVAPQIYCNLYGEVNTYLFSVAGERGIVGNILVGSSLYGYNVLQAGTAAPPAIPNNYEIGVALNKIGIKVDTAKIGNPIKLLYLGVDEFYAVYEVAGKEVAVNLIFKKAILTSGLKPTMPSPQEYENAKRITKESMNRSSKSTSPLKSTESYSNWLPMSHWDGQGRVCCGPCSGVSIGAYYRDTKGYSNIRTPQTKHYMIDITPLCKQSPLVRLGLRSMDQDLLWKPWKTAIATSATLQTIACMKMITGQLKLT